VIAKAKWNGSNGNGSNGNGSAGKDQQANLAVKSCDEALDYLCDVSPLLTRLARHCWPGPVTLVASCAHPDSAVDALPLISRQCIMGEGKTIGLRVVKHLAVQSLLHYWEGPLVLLGLCDEHGNPITTGADAVKRVSQEVSLVLEDGPTRYGGRCTTVSVSGNRFRIVEHGVVEDEVIRQFSQPLILLVCTGNTCRSPMAETLLAHQLTDADAPGKKLSARVASAGLAAMNGDRPSPQAVEVMRRRGLDLSHHQSRCADENLLLSADLILTMTQNHLNAIVRNYPQLADRVHTLRHDGGDVVDPIGGPVEVYETCAKQIDRELAMWVEKLGNDWLPVEDK
jgi:protein-tyrosine phosphatase